ncbi:MAG: hypothetical protein Q9182_006896 [Xanthomendoza sp. 2 TL-2023]
MDRVIEGSPLSLRGGVASSNRKEARRRKFQRIEPAPKLNTFKKNSINAASDSPYLSNNDNVTRLDAGDQDEAPAQPPPPPTPPAGQKAHRFVVFVGNLPYTATDASIHQHFASIKPASIRHRHERITGKSKGFAFLEFDNYDRLRTCLKTFHQSKFDDGLSPARMVNVELTAGGGGSKSKERRIKLKTKNERLRLERERRASAEAKMQGKAKKSVQEPVQKAVRGQSDNPDVHPSWRAQVREAR